MSARGNEHEFADEALEMARRYVNGGANDPLVDAIAARIYRAKFHKGIESSTPQICRIISYENALAAAAVIAERAAAGSSTGSETP